jgi:thymidylate kinase
MALACLVAGDRHHHLASEIRHQKANGAIVVCDRYIHPALFCSAWTAWTGKRSGSSTAGPTGLT